MIAVGRGFPIYESEARSVLSRTSGFIAEAGFTHSLTPARNCTFGCTYCYVPTMRVQGGLQPEDWRRWGQFTTIKSNTPQLLVRTLRRGQSIYCSPLVDPYQPAEAEAALMPAILDAVIAHPPEVFAIQTRGPLIVRDLSRLTELNRRTRLRVSFSLTTDREEVRARYEPHCASIAGRLHAMDTLRESGIRVFATLSPILPCDPEALAALALAHTGEDIIGDPLHVRAVKPRGATTRDAALRIAERHDEQCWFDSQFQAAAVERIGSAVLHAGRRFATGTEGFSWLSRM